MLFDKMTLGRQAKELGFPRDTYEKVRRLMEILMFVSQDPFLSEHLALKGGTAINLTVFDLPRLSVDIDLDLVSDASREEMQEIRRVITERIFCIKLNGALHRFLTLLTKHYKIHCWLNQGLLKCKRGWIGVYFITPLNQMLLKCFFVIKCHVFCVKHGF